MLDDERKLADLRSRGLLRTDVTPNAHHVVAPVLANGAHVDARVDQRAILAPVAGFELCAAAGLNALDDRRQLIRRHHCLDLRQAQADHFLARIAKQLATHRIGFDIAQGFAVDQFDCVWRFGQHSVDQRLSIVLDGSDPTPLHRTGQVGCDGLQQCLFLRLERSPGIGRQRCLVDNDDAAGLPVDAHERFAEFQAFASSAIGLVAAFDTRDGKFREAHCGRKPLGDDVE